MIVLTFVISWLALYMIASERTVISNIVLKLSVTFSVAVALLSFIFVLILFCRLPVLAFYIVATLLPLAYLIKQRRYLALSDLSVNIKNASTFTMAMVLALLLWYNYQYFDAVIRWGEWDAWAIWSQHGKFLLSEEHFDNLFSGELAWTHPDYPLMLPSTVAMWWSSFGITPYVPALLAWIISLMLLLVMIGSFLEKRHRFLGLLLLFLLVYTKVLFPFVLGQYADTLFALFLLLPFVVIRHTPAGRPVSYLLLTGFLAASCTWIKNEGLAFFAIFSICYLIAHIRDFRVLRFYVLGALLPLFVLAVFKLLFPFPSDFLTDPEAAVDKLTDVSRYRTVLDYGYTWFGANAKVLWITMIAVLLVNYRYYLSFPFVVIFLLAASYVAVYVITPFDLDWHLSTSFDRLIHQLLPVLMYTMFMSVGEKWTTFFQIRKFSRGRIFGMRMGK